MTAEEIISILETMPLSELLMLVIGISGTLLASHLSNKANTKNLKLQLQHQTTSNNKKRKIEKLELAQGIIVSNHHKTTEIFSALVSAKKQGVDYKIYKKIEEKLTDFIKVIQDEADLSILIAVYASHLEKDMKKHQKYFSSLTDITTISDGDYQNITEHQVKQKQKPLADSYLNLANKVVGHLQELTNN